MGACDATNDRVSACEWSFSLQFDVHVVRNGNDLNCWCIVVLKIATKKKQKIKKTEKQKQQLRSANKIAQSLQSSHTFPYIV